MAAAHAEEASAEAADLVEAVDFTEDREDRVFTEDLGLVRDLAMDLDRDFTVAVADASEDFWAC